jgi:hypothetical protein
LWAGCVSLLPRHGNDRGGMRLFRAASGDCRESAGDGRRWDLEMGSGGAGESRGKEDWKGLSAGVAEGRNVSRE